MAGSIYDIMVELNLDDKVTEGLKGIGESFDKLLEQLEKLHEGLSGAALLGAATGFALGLNKIASAADELTDSLSKLRVMGEDVEEAMMAAERATAHVPGTTAGTNIELLRRLSPLMGGAEKAGAMLPELSMADYWMRQYGHPEAIEQIVRMGRQRGLEGDALRNFVEHATKLEQATGGQYNFAQMAQAMRRGGLSTAGMSEDFLMNVMPYLSMTSGAGRDVVGGQLGKLHESLLKSGRLGGAINQKGWHDYVQSAATGVGFGTSRGAKLFAENPEQWVTVLGDALKRKFGDDPAVLKDIVMKLFTNPQLAMLVWQMMTQTAAIGQFRQRVEGRPGLDAAEQERYIRGSPKALKEAIAAQVNQIIEQLAVDIQPIYLDQLNWLRDNIKLVSKELSHTDSGVIRDAFKTAEEVIGIIGGAGLARLAIMIGGPETAPVLLAAYALAETYGIIADLKAGDTHKALEDTKKMFQDIEEWAKWLEDWLNWFNGLGARLHELLKEKLGWAPATGDEPSLTRPTVVSPADKPAPTVLPGPDNLVMPWPGALPTMKPWETQDAPIIVPNWYQGTKEGLGVGTYGGDTTALPFGGGFWGGPAPQPAPAIQYHPAPTILRPNINTNSWPPPAAPISYPGSFPPPAAPASAPSIPSFSPSIPRSEANASVNVQLNIDGRALGQVVLDRVLAMAEFSDTGTSSSAMAGYPVSDGNYRG
jgi:hypothetical protein